MNITRHNISFVVSENPVYAVFWKVDTWASQELNFIKQHPTKVLIDVGAWIGPVSLFACKLFDKVYAYEPDPVAFNELSTNVTLNNFTNIKLNQLAVSDKLETLNLGVKPQDQLGQSLTSRCFGKDSFTANTTTLRTIFETENVPVNNAFLKIDIEGGEYCLLDDLELFKQYRPIVMLEIHGPHMSEEQWSRCIKCFENIRTIYDVNDTPSKSRYFQAYMTPKL